MASISIKVSIKRAWWVMPYLNLLGAIYLATGYYPKAKHVIGIWKRGMKLVIN
ncbi:hypothetical protein [Pseudomonas sp. Ps21-P2]|uniref:hypothetical protein n=1 Tax=Pseudomonas sp. Ps21-P2 TaxID=3080331 RepID=UPI00320B18F5